MHGRKLTDKLALTLEGNSTLLSVQLPRFLQLAGQNLITINCTQGLKPKSSDLFDLLTPLALWQEEEITVITGSVFNKMKQLQVWHTIIVNITHFAN
jgi:hypothetical protein